MHSGFQGQGQYLDALATSGFLQKQKIGRGNYYVNLALGQILLAPDGVQA